MAKQRNRQNRAKKRKLDRLLKTKEESGETEGDDPHDEDAYGEAQCVKVKGEAPLPVGGFARQLRRLYTKIDAAQKIDVCVKVKGEECEDEMTVPADAIVDFADAEVKGEETDATRSSSDEEFAAARFNAIVDSLWDDNEWVHI